SGSKPGAGAVVMPDELTVAAPGGAISTATLAQRPVGEASLRVLARDTVALDAFQVAAALPEASNAVVPVTQSELGDFFNVYKGLWASAGGGLDASGRSAVDLVSSASDVRLGQLTSFSARPVRLVAGGDLLLGPLQIQHSAANELSLLQAGRDVRVGSVVGGVRLAGPGDLLVSAGRDIDLGRGTGIVTVGNLGKALLLPEGGANIAMLAGVQLAELSTAVAGQFQLVGAGLQNFPAELAVQLESQVATGTLLSAAEATKAAAAFAALKLEDRMARVRQIVGDALMRSATEAYIDRAIALAEAKSGQATVAVSAGLVSGSGRLSANPPTAGSELTALPNVVVGDLPAATPAEVRGALREALQAQSLGAALAAKARTFDGPTQQALALAVSPYTHALTSFVNQRTGSNLEAPAAAQRFKTLAPEQQALFVNQVLMAELKSAGRAAISGERVA
ncbi:MAG: hypothetical protein H7242_13390, partial [Microbacteriaceae bacterium]|nr:hypothetical protein [Burkholderiaceae bacterium]